MIANWVKQETTTTGTGTVAMTAVSGFAEISDHFNTNDIVSYIITDANGTSRESGIGTVASSTTLARTLVKETLVGGVIDNTSPAALTLTTGTHTVIISSAQGAQPPIDTFLYDSNYVDAADNYGLIGFQSDVVSANRATYGAMHLQRPRLITNIGVYVVTADAAATLSKLGIYTCLPSGKPGKLIESVTIDVTTSGLKSVALTSPRVLPAGWYYSSFATNGTPTMRATRLGEIMTSPIGFNINVPRKYNLYETLSSWSDLPATATPISGENYVPILFWT